MEQLLAGGLGFTEKVWSVTISVPPRLHRFARFYYKVNFRFGSLPLALLLEQYSSPSSTVNQALPDCEKNQCYGGVIEKFFDVVVVVGEIEVEQEIA